MNESGHAARQLGADYPFKDPEAKKWFNFYLWTHDVRMTIQEGVRTPHYQYPRTLKLLSMIKRMETYSPSSADSTQYELSASI